MNRKHPSSVFMMEMIAVIFFFILCAAICIKTFVKADYMSREAADLNQSVLIAQSVAEVWKADGPEGLERRFQASEAEDGFDCFDMEFDKAANSCQKEKAVFDVRAEVISPGQVEVDVRKNGKSVYSLTVNRHETQH